MCSITRSIMHCIVCNVVRHHAQHHAQLRAQHQAAASRARELFLIRWDRCQPLFNVFPCFRTNLS